MAHPYHHSVSHAKKFGGVPEDYLAINNFLDSTKSCYGNWKHRALLHNSFGVFLCEKVFGITITNSEGTKVPTRLIAEKHIVEDLGFIPSIQDWLKNISHENWMTRGVEKLDSK